MKNASAALLLTIACLVYSAVLSQTPTRIVVLGSSTAAGTGASVYDSSWVGRLQQAFRKNTDPGDADTIVTNLALGGYTTYHIMPDGYVPPPGRPSPDLDRNVTEALSYNPEVIIINMPSNDIASGFNETEFMNNLRFLFQHIQSFGVRAFITTTQPRNDLGDYHRQLLRQLVDSINNNFNMYAIDFWTDLATTDGQNRIRPEVSAGDAIHINNTGHRLVFEEVIAKNLFAVNSPLPLRLSGFTARAGQNQVVLSWTTELEEPNSYFIVQRSSDGLSFTNLYTVSGSAVSGNGRYSFTDRTPPAQQAYYRLQIVEGGKRTYSPVLKVNTFAATKGITRLYQQNNSLFAEITLDSKQEVVLRILSAGGSTVFQQRRVLDASATLVRIPLDNLVPGTYFLVISGSGGVRLSSSFIR